MPVEDMADPGAPAYPNEDGVPDRSRALRPRPLDLAGDLPRAAELVQEHTSTIIFVNNRRAAERLAKRLNELANGEGEQELPATEHAGHAGARLRRNSASEPTDLPSPPQPWRSPEPTTARSSHEERTVVEEMLKSGQLPCLVATSSLELGIDMGAVDLVIQVESPKSVTRGLQRIGRAGHGARRGLAKAGSSPSSAATCSSARSSPGACAKGEIEETVIPQNPLDVLAQHLVSMAALDEWEVDEVERLVTATEPFHELSREQLENVLDMLDGRYPSDRFAELRPRIVWDRTEGTIHGRKGARQLVVTNAGTIPDRGLYGVHLPDGRRVGELDEEMVYEARPGQTFLLGATTWRIEEITRDRVIVTPAPGAPGAVPFWKGDGIGRPAELGRAIGAFSREAVSREPAELAAEYDLDRARRREPRHLPARAAGRRPASSPPTRRSWSSASATRSATGGSASSRPSAAASTPPGAWRWRPKIRDERDLEADAIWSDDGIVIHLPDADEPPPADLVLIEPDEIEDLIVARALRLGPVRRPLPRERRPLAADPARLPGQAHAALAAAAEVAEPARGGAGLPPLPGHPRDLPRVPAGRARPARAGRPAAQAALAPDQPGRGRDPDRLALRLLAALRLRRHLHVRGGHAERRAAGGGAGPRPRPAARAARPGGAARADRPRGAGRGRGAAPAPHRGRPRRRPRRPAAAAAQPRRPDRGGVRGAGRRRATRPPRCWRSWSPSAASPRSGSPARSATSPPRTPASTATRSACRRRPGLPETFLEEHPDAMRALVRRYARTHGPFPTAQPGRALRRRPARRRCASWSAKGRWSAASCCRAGPSASGATPKSCAGSAAPASPACARRSRPPTRDRARPLPAELAERRRLPPRRRRPRPPARGAGAAAGRRADARRSGSADVLPRRLGAYSPTWLDELCTSGELVWIGAGALRPQRRPRRPLLPRGRPPRRPAAGQRQAGARRGRGPRRDPRAPRRRPLLLARPARRPRPPGRGAPQRALGPRLGGRGDQRRLRAAAGAAPARGRRRRAPRPPLRPPPLGRRRRRPGPLVADRAALRRRPGRRRRGCAPRPS